MPAPATTTTPRARLPRTLAALASHPWVESVSDERSMGAGIWVYLKPGFVTHDSCHTIHEPTVRECCRAFRFICHDPEDYLLEEQATRSYLADLADLAAPAPAEAAPAEAAPAALTAGQTEASWHLMLTRAVGRQIAARPVLPGEATPPPAPIAQDGPTPELPRLRADAAAGRPVSLAALARAMAEDLLTPSPSPVSLAALRPEA